MYTLTTALPIDYSSSLLPATDLQTSDGTVLTRTDPTVAAIPITIFVGTLMGVIALLILLIVIIVIISFYVHINKQKIKENQAEADNGDVEYDYAIERGTEVSTTVEMKVNEGYGICAQGDSQLDSNLESSCVYEELV